MKKAKEKIEKTISLTKKQWKAFSVDEIEKLIAQLTRIKSKAPQASEEIFGLIDQSVKTIKKGKLSGNTPLQREEEALTKSESSDDGGSFKAGNSGKKNGKRLFAEGELTPDQEEALKLIEADEDCFITGGPGTGKSWIIREWSKRTDKSVLLCAPTGVAAINIGGQTIHRLFSLPVKEDVYTPTDVSHKYSTAAAYYEPEGDKNFVKNPLYHADVLVIDEISMCRGDIFEMVMATVRGVRDNIGFDRKLKVIMVGDFFQLPPVLTNNKITKMIGSDSHEMTEKERFEKFYGNDTGYPFLSKKWKGIQSFQLTTIIRQKDKDFSESLNKIRCGDADGFAWIANASASKPIEKALWICGRNAEADKRNLEALEALPTEKHSFELTYNLHDESYREELAALRKDAKNVAKDVLCLKEGCRVIATINAPSGTYDKDVFANGSCGTVKTINREKGLVTVEFDTGKTVDIKRNVWTINKYIIEEVDGEERATVKPIASFSQFPLVLGYACTVHKSQGKTIDAINIDGNCNFLPGQLYVALSRCTNIDNVYMKTRRLPIMSKEVRDFYENVDSRSSSNKKSSSKGKKKKREHEAEKE